MADYTGNVRCFITARMPAHKMQSRDKDFVAAGSPAWLGNIGNSAKEISIGVSLSRPNLAETIAKTKTFTINFVDGQISSRLKFLEKNLADGDPLLLAEFCSVDSEAGNPAFEDALATYDYTVKKGPIEKDGMYLFEAERTTKH